jgi:hypothetical protein
MSSEAHNGKEEEKTRAEQYSISMPSIPLPTLHSKLLIHQARQELTNNQAVAISIHTMLSSPLRSLDDKKNAVPRTKTRTKNSSFSNAIIQG